STGVSHPYSPRAQATAIHTLSAADAARLFEDFDKLEASNMYMYQPWVGFSETTFHSRFLNIDEGEPLPIRRTVETQDAPANRTIWLFGGSTQFGWGVPDDQTIASQLSAILSQGPTHYRVVNYGHTQFYSSQEAVLFASLLRHGHKCDIAVFLDGLNDALTSPEDVPTLTGVTATAFLKEQEDVAAENSRYVIIAPSFPPLRVLNGLLRRLARNVTSEATPKAEQLAGTKYDPVAIYRFNMSMIQRTGKAEHVRVLFDWQPTPFDYMAGAEQRRTAFPYPAAKNIPSLNAAIRQEIKNSDFHFIADMFQGEAYQDIYVDLGHYGDKGNSMLAKMIADQLKNDGFH
ncbi:MAG: hypothetical protein WCA16_04675, partial [Candidatus Sulfotelmatobacter sp.]